MVVRRFVLSVLLVLSSVAAGVGLAPSAQAGTVGLSAPQTGRIVNEDPANFTPHILNGTVYSIVEVGDYIVVGGSFTQVRSSTNTTTITRNRVFAFNATTGVINTDFNPAPNGTVYKVQQSTDPGYVYVGGNFSTAAGASRRNLFKIRVSDGQVDTNFRPPSTNGVIRDLEVVGNHLFVAGKMTHFGGTAQRALGTVNATTGAFETYFSGVLAGYHRDHTTYPGDVTDVLQMSSNPQNTQLTAVGNFTSADGQARSQIVKYDLGQNSATLSTWYTNLFNQACSSKFDTYMTDVEYSPNGQFFVVSTTGAYGGSASSTGQSGCDVVARWESDGTTGPTPPTWSAYTGGDTTWNVEVTDNVVYAGGHQRWQNNPTRGDAAGQGAVSREGIAALNTRNGMPYSWNPTRTRGVGIQDMLATPQGLWVGSDTERIGNFEYHARIALLPLSGGDELLPEVNMTLPGTVYNVPTGSSSLSRRSFTATTPGSPSAGPGGGPAWGSVVGAFMNNGVLYYATSNGQFARWAFNGTSFTGSSQSVNAADALVPQTDWHNTDVPTMTSLFFHDGKMFFTRSGQSSLFRRGFEPESNVVGQQRFSTPNVSGINFANIRGAFVANNQFWYADTSNRLFRAAWSGNSPVGGTSVQVSGPGVDGQTWGSRAMFVFQAAGQQTDTPPVADADIECTGLTCSFDSTDSSDPDGGDIASVLWQFGDTVDNTSTSAQATHTYGASGPRTVTLTVTDDEGSTDTITRSINPQEPVDSPPTANIASASCSLLTCSFTSTGSGDAQGPVDYLWDFGDGNTSTEVNPSHPYADAGQRTVTLTVTDNAAQTATDTASVNPSDTASPVEFVGGNHTNGNRLNHQVVVPAATESGDTMVLFFSANTTTPTYTYPAGWTPVATPLNGSGIIGRAFVKVATGSDAGTTVRITSSGYAKSDLALGVYRGTDGVAAATGALDNTTTASHTSPTVNAPAGSTWLVTYWADKSSGTSTWTAPAAATERSSRYGAPSGAMAGLLADSATDVSGSTGGLTATANTSTNRALSFSVVLN